MPRFDWNANKENFSKFKKTLTILWGALMFTPLMLGFLLFQQVDSQSAVPAQEAIKNPMALPLLMVAFVSLVMSFVLPKVISRGAIQKLQTKRGMELGTNQLVPEFQVVFTTRILRYALTESVGLMGFVLGISTKSIEVGVVLIGLALLLMLWSRPTEDALIAEVDQLI